MVIKGCTGNCLQGRRQCDCETVVGKSTVFLSVAFYLLALGLFLFFIRDYLFLVIENLQRYFNA